MTRTWTVGPPQGSVVLFHIFGGKIPKVGVVQADKRLAARQPKAGTRRFLRMLVGMVIPPESSCRVFANQHVRGFANPRRGESIDQNTTVGKSKIATTVRLASWFSRPMAGKPAGRSEPPITFALCAPTPRPGSTVIGSRRSRPPLRGSAPPLHETGMGGVVRSIPPSPLGSAVASRARLRAPWRGSLPTR